MRVETTINRDVQQAHLRDDDFLIGWVKHTVQYWVEHAAAETDNDDYQRVSTHDVRRY